jgi:hypothetical protein
MVKVNVSRGGVEQLPVQARPRWSRLGLSVSVNHYATEFSPQHNADYTESRLSSRSPSCAVSNATERDFVTVTEHTPIL